MGVQNKTAVITGGALGIGRCLTRAFAEAGCRVAFFDCNREAGEENLRMLQKAGKEVLFFHGDGEKQEALEAFVQKVSNTFGNIDYLINNMCISRGGILTPCGYEDFLAVLKVGVAAPYYLTQCFLPYFNPGGAVVNISSTRAFQSQKDTESYTAAKGGITALTHAMAVSLSGRVRVNAIAPGWIDTGAYYREDYVPEVSPEDLSQHPSGRIGVPEDIARAALFLCDEGNSFINGETITVDGGMTKLMVYHNDCGWEYRPEKQ